MGAVSVMTFRWGGLPEALARFGILALVLTIAAAILGVRLVRLGGSFETSRPPSSTMAVFLLAFLCIPTWCVWLGASLSRTG
ncbi:MAG TPA: hypothetical protein VFC04_03525 [Actinomycetota bacterium]|nr:hypothetical protein [Actinomycetota bacterium]